MKGSITSLAPHAHPKSKSKLKSYPACVDVLAPTLNSKIALLDAGTRYSQDLRGPITFYSTRFGNPRHADLVYFFAIARAAMVAI
jgi:hypothetical protein